MLRLELLEKDQEVRCSGDQSQTLEILEKPVEWANGVIIVALLSLSHVRLSVTLWTEHTRLPCPSLSPRICSNSCASSLWCHSTISFSVIPFSSCPQPYPASIFSNESAVHIRWPNYWSFIFSISPSNEQSGLISLRMDWLDLFAVQGTLKSLLQHRSSEASILRHSAL